MAESNSMSLSLPSSGSSNGVDSVKMDQMQCSNSISGGTLFELGITGVINNAIAPLIGKKDPNNPQSKDVGLYARIVIPIDGPAERINCNNLFQLMLQKQRLEMTKLRQEIDLIKNMQNNTSFEN
jgi:hypothetical protein|tara:strand:+ start:1590 stop:1964 length:375 start_codon:yes stop_codon:yes gene_type:complete